MKSTQHFLIPNTFLILSILLSSCTPEKAKAIRIGALGNRVKSMFTGSSNNPKSKIQNSKSPNHTLIQQRQKPFLEPGYFPHHNADYYEQQYHQRVINNLSKKVQALGFQLVESSSARV